MESLRQQKLNSLLKKELATIFQREGKGLFGNAFISVTTVRVSADLSVAKIYLSFLMVEDKDALCYEINDRHKEVRRLLAKSAGSSLRKMPDLRFYVDDSFDYAREIDQLLKK